MTDRNWYKLPARSRIAVIGCGHVGAVTAACFAELGHHVAGVDVDPALVQTLQQGRAPFIEPDLDTLLAAGVKQDRLAFTTSYERALEQAEFVLLCVNTPATPIGAADLTYVRRAVAGAAGILASTGLRPLLVSKSTSPIGTCETIETILQRTFADSAQRPAIAANPEFLREGQAIEDFFHPQRIVVGAARTADAERVLGLYGGIEAPRVLTDLRTAEMIKYASNAFLATRVSFINEIAGLCERLDADIDTVVNGLSLDPRIGGSYLQPGIGYGGSCLPKDVAALCHTGDTAGVTMRVLQAVQATNVAQRTLAVNCIRRDLGPLEGRTVAVWGVAFKGGSEDLRESPALGVIELLRNEGAHVRLYDPALPQHDCRPIAEEICSSPIDAAQDADCVAILSDWPEFRRIDLRAAARAMRGRLLYDGRNLLTRADVEAAGLWYCGVGRRSSTEGSI